MRCFEQHKRDGGHSAPITVGKHMQAKLSPNFRCSCFTRRCLNAIGAFLVLPRVRRQVYVLV